MLCEPSAFCYRALPFSVNEPGTPVRGVLGCHQIDPLRVCLSRMRHNGWQYSYSNMTRLDDVAAASYANPDLVKPTGSVSYK